jgi:tRNA C32,U32 (ribose-2'-O)-methylase TrmJ
VNPRCDHLARPSQKASKGAQYLLWRATNYESLEEAIKGASATVAFTRWLNNLHGVPSYSSTKEFLESSVVDVKKQQGAVEIGGGQQEGQSSSVEASSKNKLVLVFGREEEGLRPEEVSACSAACSIPIGRLQESLSLSHAVSLVLSPLFEARQESLLVDSGGGVMVDSRNDLAVGVELQDD